MVCIHDFLNVTCFSLYNWPFMLPLSMACWYIYVPQTKFGRHIVFAPFLIIIILLLSFFCQKFLRHISRRCFDQTLWNLVGISYSMWSCAFKGWFFQNGCRCHGNNQKYKKNSKHKNDHSRLLAKQRLMKLDRNNIHIYWNEISQKKSESVGQTLLQLPWKQGGI